MQFFITIGWIGNIILSLGVIPQVIKTWRTHNVSSFSWMFLLNWCIGVILVFIYLLAQNIHTGEYQWSMWVNYAINIVGTIYLVFAKIRYGRKT
ncbi:MAG: PQ-loop repeat-containing protein [Bacteroidales bacterium]|nr:PQ-loop repeat-containing protein [Bacteroidales bacterium]